MGSSCVVAYSDRTSPFSSSVRFAGNPLETDDPLLLDRRQTIAGRRDDYVHDPRADSCAGVLSFDPEKGCTLTSMMRPYGKCYLRLEETDWFVFADFYWCVGAL